MQHSIGAFRHSPHLPLLRKSFTDYKVNFRFSKTRRYQQVTGGTSTIINRSTSLCQVLDAFRQSPLGVYLSSLGTLREPARCSPQLDRTTAAVLSIHFFSCALYLCLALNGGCRESIGGRVQSASLCETNRKFDAPGAKTDRLDRRHRHPPSQVIANGENVASFTYAIDPAEPCGLRGRATIMAIERWLLHFDGTYEIYAASGSKA